MTTAGLKVGERLLELAGGGWRTLVDVQVEIATGITGQVRSGGRRPRETRVSHHHASIG